VDEYAVPLLVDTAEDTDLTDLVFDRAAETPHRAVLSRRSGAGTDAWRDVTAEQFRAEVVGVAKGLIAAGIRPGDRVGLLSKTRYEWTLADFAIWTAGGVTVPVYETSSAEQIRWVLGDSGAVAVFLESRAHRATVDEVRSSLPDLAHEWIFDEGLDALVASGAGVPDSEIDERRSALGKDTLATIIYTSGTTGDPKGCELTHGNFRAEVDNVTSSMRELFFADDASTLLFLPLAHVFARVIQVGCLASNTKLAHTADVKNLVEDLSTFRPTFLLAVPRVFEKVYNSAEQKAVAAGKGKIFHSAVDVAIAHSRARDNGRAGLSLRLRHAVFDKLVYAKLRAAMGGKVRYAVSGGAPLGERLAHFFRGIGVTILEGYGLTETTAAATANLPDQQRVGSVGRPVPGVAVRIAEDGEVLIKGPVVFRGYYDNAAATSTALSPEGWFHSGDLGELDADGFVRITGRKKELIVTAAGKNVAPAVLEDRLRAHRLISQCMVVGDAQPYVACLITLDAESLPTWLEQQGKPVRPATELTGDPDLLAEIQRAVDDANKAVSRAEAIKKFRILPVDFTEEGGQLTPTLKLKRNIVLKDFAADVDALYA
jgi:long-chain acyl-CoA synthetase